MSAAYIQRTEAKQIMDYGDKEPSHINENGLVSITLLKGTPPYNNIIREIGYDKFFMHYWTSTEINSYRNYFKTTSIPTISIDATGSVVKKFNLFSGRQTPNIFLYQIAVYDQKKRKPICSRTHVIGKA